MHGSPYSVWVKIYLTIQTSVEVKMRVIVKIVLSHEILQTSQFPHFYKEIERLIASACILLISSMSQQVRMLFELTGLEQIFQCLPPLEDVPLKSEVPEPLAGLQSVAS
jgi:hypothetical protein